MHPGVVDSNFVSHCEPAMQDYMNANKARALPPEHPAEPLVWLATADEPGRKSGRYFFDKRELVPSAAALDDDAARRLWDVSEALVAGY